VPIPSYLIAIAAGEVAYKRVGKRTGVWADPVTLPKAVWEFEEDMEKFMIQAEKMLPEYEFGDYDVLILPNSFPFGGMENSK
jgi:leukotriene-A4 hydrolase